MEEKASRIIRRLVHAIFPDHCELAASSCLGQSKSSRKTGGLDRYKVIAVKEYVQRQMPHIPDKKIIRVINNVCCEARRKVLHSNHKRLVIMRPTIIS